MACRQRLLLAICPHGRNDPGTCTRGGFIPPILGVSYIIKMSRKTARTRLRAKSLLLALGAILLACSLLCPQAPSPSPEDLFKQGDALSQREEWTEAIEAYRKALAVRPHFAQGRYNLAHAYAAAQRLEEAIEEYRE